MNPNEFQLTVNAIPLLFIGQPFWKPLTLQVLSPEEEDGLIRLSDGQFKLVVLNKELGKKLKFGDIVMFNHSLHKCGRSTTKLFSQSSTLGWICTQF